MSRRPDWEDPTVKLWVQHVLDDMVPKMEDSAVVMSLVPDAEQLDVKFAVELGAAIMLDKPILAIAFGETVLSRKLRRVADEVVILPEGVSPESSDQLAAAINRVLNRRRR